MDPTLELLQVSIQELRNDPYLMSFVDGRIYDRVPEELNGESVSLESPYISINSSFFFSEDFDCIDAITLNFSFNCFSFGDGEAYNSIQVRKLAFALRRALNNKELQLTDHALVGIRHVNSNFTRAADGITWQAVVSFEADIDVMPFIFIES